MPTDTERKMVAYVQRQARLIERCLGDPVVGDAIAAHPEIMDRLENLAVRIRAFLDARAEDSSTTSRGRHGY